MAADVPRIAARRKGWNEWDMAKAGFWAIESHTIRFGRDGRWYADQEPIVNDRIARLFSQHVRRGDDGARP